MPYTVHTAETAPNDAKDVLANVKRNYGFVPNLIGMMAAAPALAKAYPAISALFEETSLSATERQIVLLAVSSQNDCEYCVAAHSVIAAMQKVPDDVIGSLREGNPIADRRLEALRRFTVSLVANRGWPSDDDKRTFFEAGYTETQALEVVLGVGLKTLSNYANHLADTPLDAAFADAKWSKAA